MTYTFEELKVKGVRRWKDENGKWKQQQRTFSQTINPFNKNVEGEPKNRSEIMEELIRERDEWVSNVEVTRGADQKGDLKQ